MDEYTGPMEEITALIKALATIVPEARHSDMGQVPVATGDQGYRTSPAVLSKKRRTTLAGPGTPSLAEPKNLLKLF